MPPGYDTPDTVTMARKEREKNEPWEAELSYGGEADLHRHSTDCKKNPGHRKFIPVDQFNVDHLPPGYHNNDIVDLIRARSDLTVRVSVKYVSNRRPETLPGSDIPYPCYKNRGSSLMRVGTGMVAKMSKFEEDITCDCKECLKSEKPRTKFAHIRIRTAAHVVYDEAEAEHTTCHLFFDRGGRPELCSGVVTLSGMTLGHSDPFSDWCTMTYATHDLDLIDKLDQMVDRHRTLDYDINKAYPIGCPRGRLISLKRSIAGKRPSNITLDQIGARKRTLHFKITKKYGIGFHRHRVKSLRRRPKRSLAFIVSHPHGCSKQVSVGYTSGLNDFNDVYFQWPFFLQFHYLYTTATCHGSSGAHVRELGRGTYSESSHSGQWPENKKLNFCYNYKWLK